MVSIMSVASIAERDERKALAQELDVAVGEEADGRSEEGFVAGQPTRRRP
jgi:hypothetical protein